MNYLVKAYLQKFFAMVPRSIGDIIYYKIQRKFGSLRCVRTSQYVDNAIRINNACGESGFKIDRRKLFELGTGRTVSTPIAMILLGADSVTTVDVNRYLRTGLAFESAGEVFKKFKELGCNKCINKYESGFNKIAAQNVLNKASIQDLLDLFNIKYNAPFNGDKTVIESGLFDLYFSTNVIEHVPKGEIEVLFKEAKRILKPNGIMAHYIDLRDHFAATDKTITNVNFLKYSTEDWHKLAGNRLNYQNRLRCSDYIKLFSKLGFVPCWIDTEIDDRSLNALKAGFEIDRTFKQYDLTDLSTVGLTVVGRFVG